MSRRAIWRRDAVRAGRVAWRLARRGLRPFLAVAVLVFTNRVAGTAVTAVVGAAGLTVGLVWWWARVVEPRLFAPRTSAPSSELVRPVIRPRSSPSDAQRHLRFAEALALVATRYVTECEHEMSDDPETRR